MFAIESFARQKGRVVMLMMMMMMMMMMMFLLILKLRYLIICIIIIISVIYLSLGFCKITLEVLSSNHPAKQLYAGAGFAPYELDPMAGQALFWQKKIEN